MPTRTSGRPLLHGAAVAHDRRTTGTFVEDQEIFLRAVTLRQQDEEMEQKTNINIGVFNL